MSRNYAQIFTAIWKDPEFRALTDSQQNLYLKLVTQPEISAVGLLSLAPRRWASLTAESDAGTIERDLKVLDAAQYVVLDMDTEEVLVRTFVRHDNGYGNQLRRKHIYADAKAVLSTRIAHALHVEFVALGLSTEAVNTPSDTSSEGVSDVPSDGVLRTPAYQPISITQPSTQNQEPLAAPKTRREPDPIWDGLVAACGINAAEITGAQRGSLNKACAELRKIEADPGEIPLRARRYREVFASAALTPPALVKHWASLASAPRPDPQSEASWQALAVGGAR